MEKKKPDDLAIGPKNRLKYKGELRSSFKTPKISIGCGASVISVVNNLCAVSVEKAFQTQLGLQGSGRNV